VAELLPLLLLQLRQLQDINSQRGEIEMCNTCGCRGAEDFESHCAGEHEPFIPEGETAQAESLSAESKFDELSDEIAEQYEKKGMSKEEAEKIGKATAYKVGVAKYGKRGMERKAKAGMKKKKSAESFEADGMNDSLFDEAQHFFEHMEKASTNALSLMQMGAIERGDYYSYIDAKIAETESRMRSYLGKSGMLKTGQMERLNIDAPMRGQHGYGGRSAYGAEDLSVKESAKIGFGFGAGILGFQIALLAGATLVGAFMGRGE
jgi:hypothetical protein